MPVATIHQLGLLHRFMAGRIRLWRWSRCALHCFDVTLVLLRNRMFATPPAEAYPFFELHRQEGGHRHSGDAQP